VSREEECTSPIAAALAGEARDVRRAVQVLGQILTDATPTGSTFDGFLYSSLGRFGADAVCESRWLNTLGHATAGLALAGLIDQFDPRSAPAATTKRRRGGRSRSASSA
jgi:hypothetical protein